MDNIDLFRILRNATTRVLQDMQEISNLQCSFKGSEYYFAGNTYREIAHKIAVELQKKYLFFDLLLPHFDNMSDILLEGKKYTEFFSHAETIENGFRIKSQNTENNPSIRVVLNPVDKFENLCRGISIISTSILIQEMRNGKWHTEIAGIYNPINDDFLCAYKESIYLNNKNIKYAERPAKINLYNGKEIEFNSVSYATIMTFKKSINGIINFEITDTLEIVPIIEIVKTSKLSHTLKRDNEQLLFNLN